MEDRAAPGGGLIRPTSREGGSRASFCSLSLSLSLSRGYLVATSASGHRRLRDRI